MRRSIQRPAHGRVSRRGFTMIELLVVIAIIGLIVAILLPAVQMARESSRRSACISNMRQIAFGATHYMETDPKKSYPPSYVGLDTSGQKHLGGTWCALILPYLDLTNFTWVVPPKRPWGVADGSQFKNIQIPVYFCPSRRSPMVEATPGTGVPGTGVGAGTCTDYAGNAGSACSNISGRGASCLLFETSVVNQPNGTMLPAEISSRAGIGTTGETYAWGGRLTVTALQNADGMSQTILFGEKFVERDHGGIQGGTEADFDLNAAPQKWADGDAFDARYPWHIVRYGNVLSNSTIESTDANLSRHWGSNHSQMVNFAFCDGKVRPLQYHIDKGVLDRLLNRADGQTVNEKDFNAL